MLISDREALNHLTTALAAPRPLAQAANAHVHSHHSFSVFGPPAEAVQAAVAAGVDILGLNDFFTTAGFDAFYQACTLAKLPGFVSIECIAIDPAAAAAGTLFNDPANPGKVYVCGKGITNPNHPGALARLAELRGHQEHRNKALLAKLDAHFQASLKTSGPTWAHVVEQTPAGNTTERHVAKAIVLRLRELTTDVNAYAEIYSKVTGSAPPEGDPAQQNHVRGALLKSGKPCYVAEDPAAFPTVHELRTLFLQLGAIPTYPILGNPLTGGERDVQALSKQLLAWGFHAVEVISPRNTDERLVEVLGMARAHQWPITDGTEHNTPAMEPLITQRSIDERFHQPLQNGSLVILGHVAERQAGYPGYIDAQGQVVPNGYATCLAAGRTAAATIRKA